MLLFRGYYVALSDELIEGGQDRRRLDHQHLPAHRAPAVEADVRRRVHLPVHDDLERVPVLADADRLSQPAATVTLVLSGLGSDLSGVDFGLRMAGAFVAALPTLIIYILFAEQFAKGLASDKPVHDARFRNHAVYSYFLTYIYGRESPVERRTLLQGTI